MFNRAHSNGPGLENGNRDSKHAAQRVDDIEDISIEQNENELKHFHARALLRRVERRSAEERQSDPQNAEQVRQELQQLLQQSEYGNALRHAAVSSARRDYSAARGRWGISLPARRR